jgi:hypothetical protein
VADRWRKCPAFAAFLAVLLAAGTQSSFGRAAEPVDPAWGRLSASHAPADAAPPSFARHVVPALTKAGCNAGACHGSFQGRGGLQLSLLGFDPAMDYENLIQASRGRRANIAAPAASLLLRKATGQMPHGGGTRLAVNSEICDLLDRYLRAGAWPSTADEPRIVRLEVEPAAVVLAIDETTAVRAIATWSDGTRTDVTPWVLYDARDENQCTVTRLGLITAVSAGKSAVSARYLGQVATVDVSVPYSPARPIEDFAPANFIDRLAAAEWQRMGVAPAPLSDDYEFVRRVHGDLIGTLPTPDEVRAFVADSSADKRARLIDALLARPEYADYWSVKWGDLLRVHRRYVGDKGLAAFSAWVKGQLRQERPLSEMVTDLLTAQGNLFQSGPVSFYFVDEKPEDLAETTAQVFLGVRLQCARCHHHPMEVWGQDDYYGLASYFTRLEVKQTQELGSQGRFGGARILRTVGQIPQSRQMRFELPPKPLGGESPDMPQTGDPRRHLADWMVAPDNPFFARNFANRYWSYLMGKGLVDPVDDVRDTNPPSIPALLDALAADFSGHGYDLKHLLRTICNSRAYQLASDLSPERDVDGRLFTHRAPRQLPAEVLLDAVNQITGTDEGFAGLPEGTRAIQLPDPSIPSDFLTTFGRPQRNNPCECARPSQPNLSQALQLVNSDSLQGKLARDEGRLALLLASGLPDTQIVEELYLWTYARPPTADEQAMIAELLSAASSRQEAFEDLLWTLLNSSEFVFSH